MTFYFILVIVICAACIVWFNVLAIRQGRAENQWAIVVVQLKKRFEYFLDLRDIVADLEMEEEAREEILEQLDDTHENFGYSYEATDLIAANTQAEELFQQITQNHQLPETEEVQAFKENWSNNTEQLNTQGELYDKSAKVFNMSTQQPHGRLISRLFGLHELHYFKEEVAEEESEPPAV